MPDIFEGTAPDGTATPPVPDTVLACEQCGEAFTPGGRGSQQRFCSATCRIAFHNSKRVTETPAPAETLSAAPIYRAPELAPKPDFDWYADDAPIVVRAQSAIAAYHNRDGDVVLRRQADMNLYESEDSIVIVTQKNLPKLIAALHGLSAATAA